MPLAAAGYIAICAIVGIGAILYSQYQRRRLRESENWPQATGRITKAEIEKDDRGDSTEYRLQVAYEFVDDGKRHMSDRIEFSRRSYVRKKSAEAQLAQFPMGSSVPVYFNPVKPEDAVLLRRAPFNTLYLVLGIGVLLLTVSLVAFSLLSR